MCSAYAYLCAGSAGQVTLCPSKQTSTHTNLTHLAHHTCTHTHDTHKCDADARYLLQTYVKR